MPTLTKSMAMWYWPTAESDLPMRNFLGKSLPATIARVIDNSTVNLFVTCNGAASYVTNVRVVSGVFDPSSFPKGWCELKPRTTAPVPTAAAPAPTPAPTAAPTTPPTTNGTSGMVLPTIGNAEVLNEIVSERYFTSETASPYAGAAGPQAVVIGYCALTLRNGFVVVGDGIAYPVNDSFQVAAIMSLTRQSAVQKIYPLMEYARLNKIAGR